jgi:hypothetical protein
MPPPAPFENEKKGDGKKRDVLKTFHPGEKSNDHPLSTTDASFYSKV